MVFVQERPDIVVTFMTLGGLDEKITAECNRYSRSNNDDEEKDKENTVSGEVEDWEQTQARGVTVKVRVSRSRGTAASGRERVEGTWENGDWVREGDEKCK